MKLGIPESWLPYILSALMLVSGAGASAIVIHMHAGGVEAPSADAVKWVGTYYGCLLSETGKYDGYFMQLEVDYCVGNTCYGTAYVEGKSKVKVELEAGPWTLNGRYKIGSGTGDVRHRMQPDGTIEGTFQTTDTNDPTGIYKGAIKLWRGTAKPADVHCAERYPGKHD